MRILALDQALVTTGWAVIEDGKLVDHGTFSTNTSHSLGDRLKYIWEKVDFLFHNYNADYIAFEDIQNQHNNDTFKRLAYVQATICLWCAWNSRDYSILAPSHWRKVLGGGFGRKRQEQKEAAIKYVKDNCGESVSSDEADAICIGLAYYKESQKNKSAF